MATIRPYSLRLMPINLVNYYLLALLQTMSANGTNDWSNPKFETLDTQCQAQLEAVT